MLVVCSSDLALCPCPIRAGYGADLGCCGRQRRGLHQGRRTAPWHPCAARAVCTRRDDRLDRYPCCRICCRSRRAMAMNTRCATWPTPISRPTWRLDDFFLGVMPLAPFVLIFSYPYTLVFLVVGLMVDVNPCSKP